MMIGKFNRFFARHGKAAFIVILLIIGVPFIFMYGTDVQSAFQPGAAGLSKVAEVNGKSVSLNDFTHHVMGLEVQSHFDGQPIMVDLQNTQHLAAIAPDVWVRVHMLQVAKDQGLDSVSPEEVAKIVRQMPMFWNENQAFDSSKYEQFKTFFRERRGVSSKQLAELLAEYVTITRLLNPYAEGVTATPLEARADFLTSPENPVTATLQVARFDHWNYGAGVDVSDSDVAAYYEAQKELELRVPEKRKLVVAYADAGDFREKVSVSDSEVEAYYAAHREDEYTRQEIEASHILIRVTDADTNETRAEKRQQAEAILARAQAGENFAALARELSQDLASKPKGGDVGWVYPGNRLWVNDKMMAMEPGIYPEVVATAQFGYHVVQKRASRTHTQPMEQVAPMIRWKLNNEKDQALYDARARARYEETKKEEYLVNARHILISARGEAGEAAVAAAEQEAAEVLKKLREGADFAELAKQHSDDPGSAQKGGDLGWHPPTIFVQEFAEACRTLAVGAISEPIKTQFGYHIIEKLAEKTEVQPYEDLRDRLISEVRQQVIKESLEKAKSTVQALADALKSTPIATVDQTQAIAIFREQAGKLAAAEGSYLKIADSGYFAATDYQVPGINGTGKELVDAAFALTPEKPLLAEPSGQGNTRFLAVLLDIQAAHAPAFDQQVKVDIRNRLLEQKKIEAARKRAREEYERMAKLLAEGKPFAEVTGDITFKQLTPFKLGEGTEDAEFKAIATDIDAAAASAGIGQLAAARDTEHGGVLVYVVAKALTTTAPEATALMETMTDHRNRQGAYVRRGIRERFQRETSVRVFWQSLEPESQTDEPPVAP